jgi:hypothetical protein
MKNGFLMAALAVAVAACDDTHTKGDASGDDAGLDAIVAVDVSAADVQGPDGAGDAGADMGEPGLDGSAIDGGGANDTGQDAGMPDVGAGTDGGDAGSDGAATTGAMCGAVSREMLCATYCDGIGRFCTGGDRQYASADECRAACNAPTWACGKQGETTGNSLFCRLAHAALAGVGSAAKECPNAGPRSPVCQ